MLVEEMTRRMVMATYQHDDTDKQVVKMAKRYRRRCITPSTKRTLNTVINSPMPTLLVRVVYDEVLLRGE
jgi:hypothetical protein